MHAISGLRKPVAVAVAVGPDRHDLDARMLEAVNAYLLHNGLSLRAGTIVDDAPAVDAGPG